MLVLATVPGCRAITLSDDRVIALEIANTAPQVFVGDTLRLAARALNAAGNLVTEVEISWAVVDTGVVAFDLSRSGLVTARVQGTGRVQASTGTLRSDPITVTIKAPPVPSPARRENP
jgi:hypothetical protein